MAVVYRDCTESRCNFAAVKVSFDGAQGYKWMLYILSKDFLSMPRQNSHEDSSRAHYVL